MSWIGLCGQGRAWTCPRRVAATAPERHVLMPRGSIMIETRVPPEERPQTLLYYRREHPRPGTISVQAMPGAASFSCWIRVARSSTPCSNAATTAASTCCA
ncbi:hypothetical protein [Ponticoccus litoralis]|uniref:Uncharacterized protein n=1 Tax=Ponticoccus litoralis TaxID=422297 RepID=A0AAW9SKP2_9RHOB